MQEFLYLTYPRGKGANIRIMENQMEKHMNNEMEASVYDIGITEGSLGVLRLLVPQALVSKYWVGGP